MANDMNQEKPGVTRYEYDTLEKGIQGAYEAAPHQYAELVNFLSERGKLPEFGFSGDMGGASGEFQHKAGDSTDRGNILFRTLYEDPVVPHPSTVIHELTHAVNNELGNQYAAFRKQKINNQFTDAYEKLFMSPKPKFFSTEKPSFLSGAEQLMEKLDPKWRKENIDYRSGTDEGLAFALGNASTGRRDPWGPPQHLDPSLATNLRLLIDLANRFPVPKTPDKKKAGGKISMPDEYRKGGKVSLI